MKKTLVALAALAATGAFAQNVTIFGSVDTGYQIGLGTTTNKTAMSTDLGGNSELGFMGKEDLGGGRSAQFKMVAFLNSDSGGGQIAGNATNPSNTNSSIAANAPAINAFAFNKEMWVGLSDKSLGTVRLGRINGQSGTVTYLFDVNNTKGSGTSFGYTMLFNLLTVNGGAIALRMNNAVEYESPSMAGFIVSGMYAAGETGSTGPNNDATAVRVTYANGPLLAMASTTHMGNGNSSTGANAVTSPTSTGLDIVWSNFGASYNFGSFRLLGDIERLQRKNAGSADDDISSVYQLGAIIPVSAAGVVKAQVGRMTVTTSSNTAIDQAANLVSLGYVHNLSKRTSLFATAARLTNTDGNSARAMALGGATNATGETSSSMGYDFGIHHNF